MRTLLLGLGLMVLMLLVTTARSGAAGVDAAEGSAEPLTLEYKWEKDRPLVYRITQETVADMSGVPGQEEVRVRQSQTMRVRLEVEALADDGTATIRNTIEAVEFDMTTPAGETVSYDSEDDAGAQDEADAPPEHAAAKAMAAFVGESFSFEVTPAGDVRNVQGMDQILAKIAEETGDPGMQEMFRGKFGDEAMEAMLEQAFKMLPDRPVEVGDTWQTSVEQVVPTLGTMRIESTMTLDRVEPTDGRQLARIPVNVVTTLDRADIQGEPLPPGTTVTMDDAKGEGVLLFDVDRGQVHEMSIVSRMPMKMRMEMGDDTMTITQNITATVKMERVEEGERPDGADEPEEQTAEE